MHDECLAGAGRALEGDGTKVVRRVVRHHLGHRVLALRLVQIGAQPFGIIEVAVQVMLGEQQGEVLMGLPRAAVLSGTPALPGHAQPAAQGGDVGVVLGELLRADGGTIVIPVQQQCRGVFALIVGVETGRQIAQPVEHVGHSSEIAEFMADEAMQCEAVLEDGHFKSRHWSCPVPCGCTSTRQADEGRAGGCRHRPPSSNINSRKTGSVVSAVQVSPCCRIAFRV